MSVNYVIDRWYWGCFPTLVTQIHVSNIMRVVWGFKTTKNIHLGLSFSQLLCIHVLSLSWVLFWHTDVYLRQQVELWSYQAKFKVWNCFARWWSERYSTNSLVTTRETTIPASWKVIKMRQLSTTATLSTIVKGEDRKYLVFWTSCITPNTVKRDRWTINWQMRGYMDENNILREAQHEFGNDRFCASDQRIV